MIYRVDYDETQNLMSVGFGDEPANNSVLVKEVFSIIERLKNQVIESHKGTALRITGAASLPVACVLASALAHIVPALAVFDPKLGKYVVSISHSPAYFVGDLLD
jgi:CRISPR-associated protein Csx3